MKRLVVSTIAATGLVLPVLAGTAAAHDGPTCSDSPLVVEVHGQHVVRDYVAGTASLSWPPAGSVGAQTSDEGAAVPGGPGPRFHFLETVEVPPGASFCTEGAQSGRAVENQRASEHVPDVR